MDDKQQTERNRPVEQGRNDDPDIRDESAPQPGVNTMSPSKYDDDNQKLTKTAADDFRTGNQGDEHADPSFDEIDEK